MCSRFVVDELVWDEMEELVGRLDRNGLSAGDIFPSHRLLILKKGTKGPEAYRQARWGYPGTGRPLINARAETVQEKASFRADFAQRRCVIPARGFYEWNALKEQFCFTGYEGALYLAGIYNNDPGKECVVILTTQANGSVRSVHDRMPLLIPRQEVWQWVTDREWAGSLLKKEPPALRCSKKEKEYEQLSLF